MKILHTSHGGLPDARVEKTALVMKKEGHELIFLGGHPTQRQDYDVFAETHCVPIVNHLRIVLDWRFKKKWINAIGRINPDIVHAHNLIAAVMMLETEYPVVYDDHEYWSKQDFRFSTRSFIRRMAGKPLVRVTPKWEEALLTNYPVLTASEKAANDHRKRCKHVGVARNFPLAAEVMNLSNPQERKGLVYIGNDFALERFALHRNMTGLREVLDFDVVTGLPHPDMMEILTQYRVGLTPWRPHPFHWYCDPNKNYEYLNAGLQVLATSTLREPLQDDPYVHFFDTYEDLQSVIEALPAQDSSDIMTHARKRYLWELNENTIRHIYQFATSANNY